MKHEEKPTFEPLPLKVEDKPQPYLYISDSTHFDSNILALISVLASYLHRSSA